MASNSKLAGLLAALFLFLTGNSALAEEAGEVQCAAALGDVWGEAGTDASLYRLDGANLASVQELAEAVDNRLVGKRTVIVEGGDFSGRDFSGTAFARLCFSGTKLAGTNWTGVHAPSIGFVGADLEGAVLRDAHMPGVLFRNANLVNVDASGADFSDGQFDGGWFESSISGWRIDGANMRGFRFDCGITLDDGCPVYTGDEAVSARGTDFSGAMLESYHLYDMDVARARLHGTRIGPGQLPDFAAAEFAGPLILAGGDTMVSVSADEARELIADHAIAAKAGNAPSFDCAKAASPVEKLICGEYESELRRLDRQMAWLYARQPVIDSNPASGKLPPQPHREAQRTWLRERNACMADPDEYAARQCVVDSYNGRIGELLAPLDDMTGLAEGEAALFVDDVLPLTDAMRGSALFARIAPVLAADSYVHVVLIARANGGYDIEGEAVGANAHTCGLGASGAHRDGKTGWYIVPHDESASFARIFRLIGDEMDIIDNGHPDYEEEPAAVDFVSCGMRASFPVMRRIMVDPAIAARYRVDPEWRP
ncbi:MAG: pentapeptide repeat-containing protein [Blastomonas sp.]